MAGVPLRVPSYEFQVGRRLNSSIESAAAGCLFVQLIERDRRQHRIADKFEHVTPHGRNAAVNVSKASFNISTIAAPDDTSLIRNRPSLRMRFR
jgi:hypothetical protein